LFGPNHAELQFPLAIENRNLIEQLQLAANRTKACAQWRYVQGVHQFIESLSGAILAFDSDRKNRFRSTSPALSRNTTRWHSVTQP
jgi:hypothetical protein